MFLGTSHLIDTRWRLRALTCVPASTLTHSAPRAGWQRIQRTSFSPTARPWACACASMRSSAARKTPSWCLCRSTPSTRRPSHSTTAPSRATTSMSPRAGPWTSQSCSRRWIRQRRRAAWCGALCSSTPATPPASASPRAACGSLSSLRWTTRSSSWCAFALRTQQRLFHADPQSAQGGSPHAPAA